MYVRVCSRLIARYGFIMFVCSGAASVAAQEPHDAQHAGHAQTGDQDIPMTRDGSGTSWLPDDTPMYALHAQASGWMLMGHGTAFLQYLHESGDRGSEQTGSTNWSMGMPQRPAAGGLVALRAMASLEPWTIGGCGYPNLLATGETCEGE